MTRQLLFLLSIMFVFISYGQSLNSLNIPTDHPRLFWNSTSLSIAKEWYSTNAFSINNSPTLSIYQGNDAMDLALKYILTEGVEDSNTRRVYARKAIEWAKLALIEMEAESSRYEEGEGTCNSCRWYTEWVFMVIDWCFDELNSGEWNLFYNSFNQIVSQWNNANWGNPTMVSNNFNHGYARQSIEWALMIYHENPTLAEILLENAINHRWANFINYTNNGGIGGIPSEGTSYAYTMLTYHLYSGMSLSNAGYDYFNETDFFKKAIAHTLYNTTPKPTYVGPNSVNSYVLPYPYGDSGAFMNINPWAEPLGSGHASFMLISAYLRQGIGTLPEYAKNWVETHNRYTINDAPPLFVRSITDHLPSKSISENPLDYFSPDGAGELPYGYSRTSWTDLDASSLFVQLGKASLGGHEHFDAGNYIITKGDRFLVIPPSGRGYGSGWRIPDYDGANSQGIDVNNSIAKNTILFGLEGSQPRAYTTGSIDRLQSHTDFFYAANNLTSTYKNSENSDPNHTNEHCKSFTRETIFIKKLETTIVFDRTESEASQNQTKTSLLHVQNEPILTNTNEYTVTNGNYEAVINILLPSNRSIKIVDESRVTGYAEREDNPNRLQIENTETGIVYFLNVIQAKGVNESNIVTNMVETDSTINIQLSHPTKGYAIIEFEKGISSSKGKIGYNENSFPTSLISLKEDAQSITVTDDGPIWGTNELEYTEVPVYESCGLSHFQNNNEFQVSFNDAISNSVRFRVYDLLGRKILSSRIALSEGKGIIDLSALKGGNVYILEYFLESCKGVIKIFKQ